jgi:hypothetical protein
MLPRSRRCPSALLQCSLPSSSGSSVPERRQTGRRTVRKTLLRNRQRRRARRRRTMGGRFVRQQQTARSSMVGPAAVSGMSTSAMRSPLSLAAVARPTARRSLATSTATKALTRAGPNRFSFSNRCSGGSPRSRTIQSHAHVSNRASQLNPCLESLGSGPTCFSYSATSCSWKLGSSRLCSSQASGPRRAQSWPASRPGSSPGARAALHALDLAFQALGAGMPRALMPAHEDTEDGSRARARAGRLWGATG